MPAPDPLHALLLRTRTIAVVGLSPKPHRDSYRIAAYMQQHGYRIVPVNPNAREVLGERAWPDLLQAAQHERIEMVNCFRNSEDIEPLAEQAIAIGATSLWLQLGVRNERAAARARAAGLLVVQDRCLKVEHARLQLAGKR